MKNLINNPVLLKILDEAPLPIGIYEGPELRFVFINKAGARGILKSQDEVIGRPYGGSDREKYLGTTSAARELGILSRLSSLHERASGSRGHKRLP